MLIKNIILVLVILSLLIVLLKPQRVIAEPVEIEIRSSNIKVYAFEKVLDRWGESQWSYFSDLVRKEGNWDNEAQNPDSTAYGIGQFLDTTWETVDCEKTNNKYKQIDCMLDYVEVRYETPEKAIKFHNQNNFY